jgi:AdoMet-dependent heme synthase
MQTLFLMLTGGEPMLHPQFFEIGAIAKELGFVTRVRTNGHSLGRRNIERLLKEVDPYRAEISLHGATAETHDLQTRVTGSFDKLTNNIRVAVEAGLKIEMVTTPTKWNQHQIPEIFQLTDELGVTLRFQGPVMPRDNGDKSPLAIQPSADVWAVVREEQGKRRAAPTPPDEDCPAPSDEDLPSQKAATCGVGVGGVDIDPYGNIKACMHLERNAGNLHEHSIREIWHASPLFTDARARAEQAAEALQGKTREQFGAPIYCLAVEENFNKPFQPSAESTKEATPTELIRLISRA